MAEIESFIKEYIAKSPLNNLYPEDPNPIFDEPLIGFANGQDKLFNDYKVIIGDFHLTPDELLNNTGAIKNSSVICWVLPFWIFRSFRATDPV